jgi:hypothetical protein
MRPIIKQSKKETIQYTKNEVQRFRKDLLKVNHNKTHLIASRETSLVVDGYPRSGNSFFVRLIIHQLEENDLSNLSLSHHTHRVENIKLAHHYGVPAVVLIRDPYDAIASFFIFQKFCLPIIECIKKYLHFYNFVLSFNANILIVNFDTVISNPNLVLEHIQKNFDIKIPMVKNLEAATKAIEAKTLDFSLNVQNKNSHIYRAAIPMPERAFLKKDIIDMVKRECDKYMITGLFDYIQSNYAI